MKKFQSKTFLKSSKYALNGLRLVFKSERNFRKHLIIALFCVLLALYLKLDVLPLCLIIFANSLVLICEIFNSIIEFIMDAYYKNKWARLALYAKDMGAGVVLLSSIVSFSLTLLLCFAKIKKII